MVMINSHKCSYVLYGNEPFVSVVSGPTINDLVFMSVI